MDNLFFVASKVFWLAIQPLTVILVLCVLGALFSWAGRQRSATVVIALCALVVWLTAFTTLGEHVIARLEQSYPVAPPLPDAPVTAIIVLGGGVELGASEGPSGFELGPGGDRVIEGFILARRHPDAVVVVTGGNGALASGEASDGDGARAPRIYAALGLAPDRLLIETQSRSTAEHPGYLRPILDPYLAANPGTVLLVTSAFHMPRAKAVFDKAGFETVAWPVDYRARSEPPLRIFSEFPVTGFSLTAIAMREMIGLVAYRLTGRL